MYAKYFGLLAALLLFAESCDSTSFSGNHQRRSASKPKQSQAMPKIEEPQPPAAVDPCSKQGTVVEQQESAKKIFFYAPNDPNTNPYFNPIVNQLTTSGYQVKVSDTIRDSVVGEVDGCKLWASYKQIWLWLPCKDGTIAKSMDPDSQTALKQFYEGGGGLAVFPDSHFDNNGGNHCTADGDWGDSVDIRMVESMLGIEFNFVTHKDPAPKARGNHPFAIARTGITPIWPVVISSTNPAWQSLDFSDSSGMIEKDLQDGTKSVALVIADSYNYHGLNGGDAMPYVDIANYFESTWGTRSSAMTSLTSRDQPWVPLPVRHFFSKEVRENLHSTDPVIVANALTYGAKMGDLKLEEIASYLDNKEFRIRINAAYALCTIANRLGSVRLILDQMAKGEFSGKSLQGYVRALGCAGNPEALPALQALNASDQGASFQSELDHALKVLGEQR